MSERLLLVPWSRVLRGMVFGPRRDEEERREDLSPSWGPSAMTVSLRACLGGRFGRMEMDAQGLPAPGSALACQGLPPACKGLRGPTS